MVHENFRVYYSKNPQIELDISCFKILSPGNVFKVLLKEIDILICKVRKQICLLQYKILDAYQITLMNLSFSCISKELFKPKSLICLHSLILYFVDKCTF